MFGADPLIKPLLIALVTFAGLIGYFKLQRRRDRIFVLLGLSLAYYALIDLRSVLFIAPLMGMNYGASLYSAKASPGHRKRAFLAIVFCNILFWLAFRVPRPEMPHAPVGLSFIIFTLLGYQIDLYRRKTKSSIKALDFGVFVLWAPKISQGPIERYDSFVSQNNTPPIFSNRKFSSALRLILLGVFKKTVIADRLGLFVGFIYDQNLDFSGMQYLLATIFFAFQIYADFSGYTDIARGISRLFGYELSINFRQPYLAKSISEFWTRWHITLSGWLRDYLYLPLAFRLSKSLPKERYLGLKTDKWIYGAATGVTFLACGLWHGVHLRFVLWGLLYGALLTLSAWTRRSRIRMRMRRILPGAVHRAVQIAVTFSIVSFAWIIFRASSMTQAFKIMARIPGGVVAFVKEVVGSGAQGLNLKAGLKPLLMGQTQEEFLIAWLGILFLLGLDFIQERWKGEQRLAAWPPWLRWGVYYALTAAILIFGAFNAGRSFIYVQF